MAGQVNRRHLLDHQVSRRPLCDTHPGQPGSEFRRKRYHGHFRDRANISSLHGRERHAAYAASKAGLLGLTTSLAVELAPRVRVNCVSPGATATPMFAHAVTEYVSPLTAGDRERVTIAEQARMLLGRVAEPAEIAAAIVYLALDAGYSTGTVLTVDGGYSSR
jgi:NAD(P)-dependent dehydrogenase (short-subunit alcohol dehydrogenase family)